MWLGGCGFGGVFADYFGCLVCCFEWLVCLWVICDCLILGELMCCVDLLGLV